MLYSCFLLSEPRDFVTAPDGFNKDSIVMSAALISGVGDGDPGKLRKRKGESSKIVYGWSELSSGGLY